MPTNPLLVILFMGGCMIELFLLKGMVDKLCNRKKLGLYIKKNKNKY